MCSQPPKNVEDGWLLDEIKLCPQLIDKGTRSIGFIGGKPLLQWRAFLQILADCKALLPNTAIQVLSNGRAFVEWKVVDAWAGVGHPNLTIAIPL
jgi:hypothetical protein